jgi:ubiquinone/menaquinone biosynthesis C-methylase UbiE
MGLNLEGNQTGQWPILQGNANDMNQFTDGQFRTVLCNAMLEHDRYFWKTIAEIDRVTASGGWIVIGVPGYRGMGLESYFPNRRSLFARFAAWFARGSVRDVFQAGAPTVGVHCYPGDYYRFSEQAVREVFMDGLESVSVRTVMNPPRFISWGKKP